MEFIGEGSALIKVFEGLAIVRVGGGE